MNKLTPLMIVFALAVLPLVSAELVTSGVALDATLLYYQPVPAQPGDEIDVWIQISNNGGTASRPGTLTVIASGPFVTESETERVKEFPSIPAREAFLIKGKARISKDANEGEALYRVIVQEESSRSTIERDLNITIIGKDSALAIESATTNPSEIAPGEQGTLTIKLRNIGSTLIRNVDMTIDVNNVDFTPVGSSNSKTISSLPGGEEHTFTFDLIAFPAALPNAYQLPVTLDYEDETGTKKIQNETIGILVGTTPELLAYFDDVSITDNSGDVVIRFVNKGLAEIKLLEAEVVENEDVKVISESSVIYVGNIDEDDYESAEFTIKVSSDDVTLPVVVRYKDALNRDYTEQFNLAVHAQNGGEEKGTSKGKIVLVLVLVGAGVWWWRKRKKDKKR